MQGHSRRHYTLFPEMQHTALPGNTDPQAYFKNFISVSATLSITAAVQLRQDRSLLP
jgi:hypothetical protein